MSQQPVRLARDRAGQGVHYFSLFCWQGGRKNKTCLLSINGCPPIRQNIVLNASTTARNYDV